FPSPFERSHREDSRPRRGEAREQPCSVTRVSSAPPPAIDISCKWPAARRQGNERRRHPEMTFLSLQILPAAERSAGNEVRHVEKRAPATRRASAEDLVTIPGLVRLLAPEAVWCEEIHVEGHRRAVHDPLGDAASDGGRELEAVTTEPRDEHEPIEPGQRT